MKKLVILLAVSIAFFVTATAQNITGQWHGELSVQNTKLPIVFNIKNENGTYSATMDSPNQGAKGIPMSSASFENPVVKIEFESAKILYTGTLKNDTLITGNFTQGGLNMALDLVRGERKVNRPQEPKKPFPYESEDITFPNTEAGITLGGTLTYPKEKEKFPAVVLISGSGQQNRDEEIMDHKPFLVLSDYLTRKGIAVLRFDDRGVGQSGGIPANATTADFATDAYAAVQYLQTRKEIDTKKIGLIGHSEGGIIAFTLAPKHKDIAFIVSMAGTGVSGDSIIIMQNRVALKQMGLTDERIEYSVGKVRQMINLVNRHRAEYVAANADSLTFEVMPEMAMMPEENRPKPLESFNSAWMRYFTTYNPATDIVNIKCPVLILNGDKDTQVESLINVPAIETALNKGGNKKYTVKRYPNLNHLFQNCETGQVTEYATIEETLSPEVLNDIAEWILKTTK